MTADEPHKLTLSEASDLIHSGDLSPSRYLDDLLTRTAALNPYLHAYVALTEDQARQEAALASNEIARGLWRGPLHGIPIGLKDIYDLAGVATTGHSRLFLDRIAARDARSVRRLRAAGAVITGKLATYELAFGGPSTDLPFPLARNPWALDRATGGSSTGSAVCVAASLLPAATGSDTAGSIRGPAALQGVTGLKPTYDVISREGVLPLSWSLDHCGPIARTARDCELVLESMAEPDQLEVIRRNFARRPLKDLRGARIGLVRHFYEDDIVADEPTRNCIDSAAEIFRAMGAEVVEERLSSLHDYHACCLVILLSEAFALYRDDLTRIDAPFGDNFRDRVRTGALLSAADYVDALRMRTVLQTELSRAFHRCDLLMTAVVPSAPPPVASVSKLAILESSYPTAPFNVGGGPAVSVPAGLSPDRLPLGFQLAGRPYDDLFVVAAAKAFQQATRYHLTLPDTSELIR